MDDIYDLNRFVEAQRDDHERALSEITSGQKRTHWIWYIFPQLDGLAFSPTAKCYAIKSVDEARAYLAHPILGPRLLNCAEAVVPSPNVHTAAMLLPSGSVANTSNVMSVTSTSATAPAVWKSWLRALITGA